MSVHWMWSHTILYYTKDRCWPKTWTALSPTLFPRSPPRVPGPKHSISVPSSAGVAVTLSVDENEVALVPNPVPAVAVKAFPAPQVEVTLELLCTRGHSLLPFTLQVVTSVLSPLTSHLKVMVSPGQVGGAAVNWPAAAAADKWKAVVLWENVTVLVGYKWDSCCLKSSYLCPSRFRGVMIVTN